MIQDLLLDELLSKDRRFTLAYRGHALVVAVTEPAVPYSSIRIQVFLDGRRMTKKSAFSTTRIPLPIPAASGQQQVEVRIAISLLGAVTSCSVLDETGEQPMSEV